MKPTKAQRETIHRCWSEHTYDFSSRRCSCGTSVSFGDGEWDFHVALAIHEALTLLKSRL